MKIHSDKLTRQDFVESAKKAGASIIWETFDLAGSRSRKQSFIVHLSGSSPYRAGFAGNNGYLAATWDEWGMFLAALFDVDPAAHAGKNSYHSRDHFHWVTGDRFKTLMPSLQHRRHKWDSNGRSEHGWSFSCKCGATQHQSYGGAA